MRAGRKQPLWQMKLAESQRYQFHRQMIDILTGVYIMLGSYAGQGVSKPKFLNVELRVH